VVCGNRVFELLQGRLHGLYVAQVEKMYQKKFSESLPEDWSEKLSEAGKVVVAKEVGGLAMVKCGEGVTDSRGTNISDGAVLPVEKARKDMEQVTVAVHNMNDKAVVKDRVVQLLQGRVHGLFPSQVEKMYKKQWGDSLDVDWFSDMEQSGAALVDREGEQVVLRLRVNGMKNIVGCGLEGLGNVIDGISELDIVGRTNGGRRGMVDKVRQMGRVKQLLQGRIHGLYVAQAEKMYQKQWGDNLANTWWEKLEQAASVEVERMQSGQVLIRWREGTGH
jgi:hypothetical protein